MLEGLREGSFPVQVRHGSAFPFPVFKASAEAGFDAIEGGPVSYNLPYSRAPLDKTVAAWADATRFWAEYGQREGCVTHLETFGGSMFGQLCPPSLLVALSVLEGSFFVEPGIESLSLSLAQPTNDAQDVGAIMALSRLARHYFPNIDWHIVFYTFMGLFPKTPQRSRGDHPGQCAHSGIGRSASTDRQNGWRSPGDPDSRTEYRGTSLGS